MVCSEAIDRRPKRVHSRNKHSTVPWSWQASNRINLPIYPTGGGLSEKGNPFIVFRYDGNVCLGGRESEEDINW